MVCALLVEQSVAQWEQTVSMYFDSRSLFHIINAAVVWLSYDYFFEKKKFARFHRAADRHPYEIVKPFGNCNVAE